MNQDTEKNQYDEEPVMYCTRCLSLAVMEDKKHRLFCLKCGAQADRIDVCDIFKWEQLYKRVFGHSHIPQKYDVYSDLSESYQEDATEVMTESEAMDCNLTVRDVMNLNINKLHE